MRTVARAAATALAALVLAGCGTGDDEPATTTTADAGTAEAATTSVGGGAETATAPGATSTPAAPGFRLVPVSDGFDQPVLVTSPPDDPRLFVVEQTGRVWILRDGRRVPQPFLDVRDDIVSGGEQGLLGLAFAPDFVRSGTVVVNYTNREGDTRIVSFRAPGGGDRVDRASARVLLAIDQPYPNHNGGHVLFGPDGMLWIGMGDGGSSGDPEGRAQNPEELLGKLLRVDVRPPG